MSECLLNKLSSLEHVWLGITKYLSFDDLMNLEKSEILEADENGQVYLIGLALNNFEQNDDQESRNVLELVSKCPKLKRFNLPSPCNPSISEDLGRLLGKFCPKIQEVITLRTFFVKENYKTLIMSYLDSLSPEICNLRRIQVDDLSPRQLSKVFKMSQNLEEICIAWLDMRTTDELINSMTLGSLQKLRKLTIKLVIDNSLPQLLDCFPDCSKMTLSIDEFDKSVDYQHAFRSIKAKNFDVIRCDGLNEQVLKYLDPLKIQKINLVYEDGEDQLITQFIACSNLREIVVSFYQVTGFDDCELFEKLNNIEVFPRLMLIKTTDRSYVSVGCDESLVAIEKLVEKRPRMKFSIHSCLVNIKNLKRFNKVLAKNKNLEITGHVEIDFEGFDPDTVDDCLLVIKQLYTSSNLRGNVDVLRQSESARITEETIKKLLESDEIKDYLRISKKKLSARDDFIPVFEVDADDIEFNVINDVD